MSTFRATLLATFVLGWAASALAQAPVDPAATPKVDARQARQQARINQGVASGELTPKEAGRMQAKQDQIAGQKAAAKADGVVTKDERRALHASQNDASRRIKKQKHDRQHTAPAS